MIRRNQKIIFLLILLILFFSNYSCSDNHSSSIQQNEVKLIYSAENGKDVYIKGDRLGEKIVVYFNGKVEKYIIYYESEDVLLKSSQISISEIKELNNLFIEFNFN
ncbi:MAG: hypothetical protein KJ799_04925 [Bacteroidetes bacterium]|nr:hypothetical protein [Bacteroidota bacterium]